MERAKNIKGWRGGLALAGCMALSVFALLLWGKLKLVTGAPRTAYADPEIKASTSPGATRAPTTPPPAVPADRPDLSGD